MKALVVTNGAGGVKAASCSPAAFREGMRPVSDLLNAHARSSARFVARAIVSDSAADLRPGAAALHRRHGTFPSTIMAQCCTATFAECTARKCGRLWAKQQLELLIARFGTYLRNTFSSTVAKQAWLSCAKLQGVVAFFEILVMSMSQSGSRKILRDRTGHLTVTLHHGNPCSTLSLHSTVRLTDQ